MEGSGSQENLGAIPSQENRPNAELVVPFVAAIRPEAKNKISGHDRSLDIVFDEINTQAIEGFQINNSEKFPGVSFSSIHLCVTPELIGKINPRINSLQESGMAEINTEDKPKHYVYFIEPAFGKPPEENAFSALDVGIDRFIREMPKVASQIKKGKRPPGIDIYILGSPTGFGGHVTEQWAEQAKEDALAMQGKLFAEFVKHNLPKDPEELKNTSIVIQGVSKGAVTAAETSRNLSEEIKTNAHIIQRLYDGPVGIHERNLPSQIVKGANMVLGVGGEFAIRKTGAKIGADIITRSLSQAEPQFYKEMALKFNLPEDDFPQKKLKRSVAKSVIWSIVKGHPLDTSEKASIRSPEFDPSNFNVGNFVRIIKNSIGPREKILRFGGKGKISSVATSRKAHFFAHKKSFRAWGEVMQFIEGKSSAPDK